MKITLLYTGKTRFSYLEEGIGDYLKRISRYMPLEVVVIPDVRVSKNTAQGEVKRLEGEQMMKRIRPTDHVILLDEGGKRFSSVQFARHLASLEGKTGKSVFVTGGAYGFAEEIYRRADEKLSLSDMTFSHQMVRLIFAEQLYRACTILNGEPYHHR